MQVQLQDAQASSAVDVNVMADVDKTDPFEQWDQIFSH